MSPWSSPCSSFRFSRRRQVQFLATYAWSKTGGLLTDVQRGRGRLFVYEVVYSISRALGRSPRPMRRLGLDRIDTRFGRFALRPGTIDAACASPAFERPDVDRLLAELDSYRRAERDVVFLDVGADLGTYAVTVANHDPYIRGFAFEPAASSGALLVRNLELNAVEGRVEVVRAACGDGSTNEAVLTFDDDEPGSSGIRSGLVAGARHETVRVTTIDDALGSEPLDVVVVKMDVEGYEVPALRGAQGAVDRARECLLLVEDFVDDAVVDHLEAQGWAFVDKLTPYNSFWRRHAA